MTKLSVIIGMAIGAFIVNHKQPKEAVKIVFHQTSAILCVAIMERINGQRK